MQWKNLNLIDNKCKSTQNCDTTSAQKKIQIFVTEVIFQTQIPPYQFLPSVEHLEIKLIPLFSLKFHHVCAFLFCFSAAFATFLIHIIFLHTWVQF